jgi:hypothetical protein
MTVDEAHWLVALLTETIAGRKLASQNFRVVKE